MEKNEQEYCDQLCVRSGRVEVCGLKLPPNRLCPGARKHVQ